MKPVFFALICWLLVAALEAQTVPAATPAASPTPVAAATTPNPVLIIQLTSDVVSFFKASVVVAGIFVTALAFIGVAFFGFDVRRARSSIQAAEDDARKTSRSARELFENITSQHDKLKDLERRVEEIGAQAEAVVDTQLVEPHSGQRDNSDLLREIIATSSFTWTTIGRLTKKTGLSRDEVLELARKTPGIEISMGLKTHDFIFRIRNGS